MAPSIAPVAMACADPWSKPLERNNCVLLLNTWLTTSKPWLVSTDRSRPLHCPCCSPNWPGPFENVRQRYWVAYSQYSLDYFFHRAISSILATKDQHGNQKCHYYLFPFHLFLIYRYSFEARPKTLWTMPK